jgi:type III secretion system YscQ/HrcQ family protein
MPPLPIPDAAAPAFQFRLPSYSYAERELVNWASRFLHRGICWEERLRDTLGDLLEAPDQKEWVVQTRHWMDRERPVTQTIFNQETFTIGRADENDIALAESTINREHARLHRRGDVYFLEDLGSRLGTFIGDKKLLPHTPTPLSPGVTFTIFPYSLEITSRFLWRREDRFRVQASHTRAATWAEAQAQQSSDAIPVQVRFPPAEGSGAFSITGRLLDELMRGLIGKDHLAAAGLLATDAGCLDYVLAALSERLRQELRWPFLAEFGSWVRPPILDPDTRGLQVAAQVSIRDCVGSVRLFLPVSLLQAMQSQSPNPIARESFREVEWNCELELSEVPVAATDLRSIGPGDTVLLTPRPCLRLPGGLAGFRCRTSGSNFRDFIVNNSVERLSRVESPLSAPNANPNESSATKAELRDLPVLLQVILGERQFSLGDLQNFTEGTLISLERSDADPVRLAVNGKVLGSGELVRIEDHIGVRVLGWNQ